MRSSPVPAIPPQSRKSSAEFLSISVLCMLRFLCVFVCDVYVVSGKLGMEIDGGEKEQDRIGLRLNWISSDKYINKALYILLVLRPSCYSTLWYTRGFVNETRVLLLLEWM